MHIDIVFASRENLELIPYCLVKIRKEDTYTTFNPVLEKDREIDFAGYRILEHSDGVNKLDEIADIVSGDLKLKKAESVTYVISFLNEMSREGIVAWRNQPCSKIKLPAPSQVFWDITAQCNLRCVHCYNSDEKPNGKDLSTDEVKRTLDEMRAFGVGSIIYSGGEPFMREDFAEIAIYSANLGFSYVSIATNGSFLTREIASRLKHPNLHIQVSIDGDNAKTHDAMRCVGGSFDSAVACVKILMEEDVQFKTCTTVTNLNFDRIPNIIQLMDELGIKNFRFQGMLAVGRGRGNANQIRLSPGRMKTLVEYLKSKNLDPGGLSFTLDTPPNTPVDFTVSGACSAGYTTCSITSDGTVVPCTYFWGMNGENIRDHSFQWIWDNSKLLNYFRDIKLNEIKGACRQCAWFMRCHGGCRAETYMDGDLFGSNRHCWVAEENAHKFEMENRRIDIEKCLNNEAIHGGA